MAIAESVNVPFVWGELSLHVSARSDRGNVREVNEDSFVAAHPVFLVADGMGGHEHGDKASQEVARVFSTLVGETSLSHARVLDALRSANGAVRALGQNAEGDSIAGTTLSGLAFISDSSSVSTYWMAFNIGDSRVYGWDGLALSQLTVDHSAVQELVDGGVISAEEALSHPQRNVITRAVGVEEQIDADVWLLPAAGHQFFIICSDGLTKEISDARMAELLTEHVSEDATTIADLLVDAALELGGRDNVTVVVVESTLLATDLGVGSRAPGGEFLEETLPRI